MEKRLSREEVLAAIEGISNEERIPFVKKLLDKKNKGSTSDDSTVILKEWRKLGGVYHGGHTCIPKRRIRIR